MQSTVIPAEKWSELKTAKELFQAVGMEYDSSFDDSNEDGDFVALEPMMHELACQAGVLKVLFARNAFDKSDGSVDGIRADVVTTVREAVALLSVFGGQGMLKCNCTGSCATNRCSCKKNSLLCNSRCHGGNNKCSNK